MFPLFDGGDGALADGGGGGGGAGPAGPKQKQYTLNFVEHGF